MHNQGHEIACHGYDHRLAYDMNPEQFREDIRNSKKILEDIIGDEVNGYRAPSYSITKRSLWAFEILAEEGYRYDSSIFPIRHDRYGVPDAPRFPFIISFNGNNTFEFKSLNIETATAGNCRPTAIQIDSELQHGNTAALNNSINSSNSINPINPSNSTNSISPNNPINPNNLSREMRPALWSVKTTPWGAYFTGTQ
jgi:hypothetical protein